MRTKSALPIWMALATSLPAAATAADAPVDELEAVVITGSRIATTSKEGPSPVAIITAEDMAARGFTTVHEALSSLSQVTGNAQNETQAGGFTQNANSIDLRGIGPGRTLVLVDGRRVTDYPLPYDSASNFVNLSAIPAAAVDRIEVLAAGASAIYGSDAVAGVVNIILKKKTDLPINVELRYGDTTQGGGQSMRAQFVTSFATDRFNSLFAAEVLQRDPIYAFQRKFQDSVLDNPDADAHFNSRSLLRLDPFDVNDDGFDYIDPGTSACDAFPTLTYSFRPGRGYYCGDEFGNSQHTLRNKRLSTSVLGKFSYQLQDGVELYGSLSHHGSKDRVDTDFTFFSTSNMIPEGYFFDVSQDPDGLGGSFTLLQRLFQPAEVGGYSARQNRFSENVVDLAAGVRGDMIGGWRYDFTLSNSDYKVTTRRRLLKNQPLLDYFLGPQLSDTNGDPLYDPIIGAFPVYAVNWTRYYSPVTPEQYDSLTGSDVSHASSYNRSASLVLSGDLWELPAGPLSAAVVFEAAKQAYDVTLDDELLNGEFFGVRDTGGGGSRKRSALGIELGVPVTSQVRMQLAGRYDDYNDITAVNGAFTYNLGLEYRPVKQLLLRGSYATSFRAPDMHYVFADPSGYFVDVTDEYLCRRDQPNVSLAACTILSGESIEGARQGNPFLQEETSDSWTAGFVFQPLNNVRLGVDFYDIKLKGAVLDDSESTLLETEADCRLGHTTGNEPVDINSLKCQAALARVVRRPNDGGFESEFLDQVITGPINTAVIHTSGIDAEAGWRIPTGAWGEFDLRLGYTQVFKYDQQDFATDAVVDELASLQYFDWHSRINASVGWSKGNFNSTLFVIRNGSVPNWAETGRLGSFTTANLTARYSGLLGGKVYVGLVLDNLFDRKPPRDPTFDTYPYYSDFNYSPIGREVFVEIGAQF